MQDISRVNKDVIVYDVSIFAVINVYNVSIFVIINFTHYSKHFTSSKLTVKTLETRVKHIQSYQQRDQSDVIDVALLFLLLTLNIFYIFFSVSGVYFEQVYACLEANVTSLLIQVKKDQMQSFFSAVFSRILTSNRVFWASTGKSPVHMENNTKQNKHHMWSFITQ